MAEPIGLDVKVGMDITEMQAEIQKSQNLLREFQAQLKRSTNTIEIKMLEDEIAKLNTGIGSLRQQMGNVAAGSDRATQALGNLSRIAQDAPYGFIGISNNINPMLESFQRLQKESGSTSAALKSMLSSLTGPAGLGLAIGVASSLLVTFGDKLFKASDAQKAATDKAKEHTDQLKKEKDAIDQIYSSVAAESTQVSSLVAVLQNENETRNRKIHALEQLKKINPEIFGALSLENNAVAGLNTAYEKYIDNLQNVIFLKIKQKELEDVTEKILKAQGVLLTQEEKDIAATGKALRDSANSRKTDVELRNNATKSQIDQNKKEVELNGLLEQRKKIFDSIKSVTPEVKIQGEYSAPKSDKILTTEQRRVEILKRAINVGGEPEEIKDNIDDVIKYAEKKQKEYEDYLSAGYKRRQKENTKEFDENKKELDKQQKNYERFAMSISNELTNAFMTMWGAMKKGEDVLQALGDMLGQILQKLIASVIQATIFAGIMSLIPGAGGGLGFGALFGKALGFADGGIISKPTYGLVGEGGQSEAIMPLNKLGNMMNNTFQAGAMAGVGGGGGATVTLRGQDLLIALNRTQKASNLKGQSISLA